MSFEIDACHFNSDVQGAFYLKWFAVMTFTIHFAKYSSNKEDIDIEAD